MVGDTILIKDISINGNDNLTNADQLSETLTDNTINALGIDASSRTIWINGQPYGNAYVNVKEGGTLEKPIGGEIFNDFENNIASGEYSHAEGQNTKAIGSVSHAEGYNTRASASYSHAEGFKTQTTNKGEHAEGLSNVSIQGKTVHTVGIGSAEDNVEDRKNAEEIHLDGKHYVYGIGGYDGTNSEDDDVKTVQTVVNESINQITINYLKLKELRDASQLVPGKEYRINDYICTTTQTGTRSAGNVFDIIVTADSESTLNEEARAINHEFDAPNQDHFKDCNLNAWQIWYCLDNDTTRFAWADATNGKGVIYRMIDEWNNDVPYDFKNIQYNGSWGYWTYTFNWINDKSDNSCEDLSVAQYVHTNIEGGYSHTCGNVINPCELREDGNYGYPLKLNVCVFLNTETYDSGLFYGCSSNSFGNNCYENTFGNGCNGNSFGNNCYENTFGNGCYGNAFGNNCYGNTFGNNCDYNAFGNGCYGNTFGNGCYGNTFRHGCYSNAFGDRCYGNAFENYCNRVAFGNDCNSNSFGDSCYFIKFASDSSASTKHNYYRYNHFGDGCQYIVFTGTEPESSSQQVQNYNFAQGVRGTYDVYLTIDGKRSRAYETYISRDTDGTIRESVIADKLDKMIEIEYLDLLYLRDFGELIPGQQYRIIDYDTIVNETDTVYKSAHNLFDIIVTADSHNKLNEVARAINHNFIIPYADHFNYCNLSAWKIWYSLDNDATLFDWAANTMPKLVIKYTDAGSSVLKTAEYVHIIFTGNKKYGLWRITDTPEVYIGTTTIDIGASVDRMQIENHVWTVVQTNYGMISKRITDGGKGVIYRMIDEFNNDIPYDFKNIQFKYPNDTETYTYYYYTFASDNTENNNDYSLDKSNECHSNTIKPYIKITSTGKQMQLNRIMFIGGRGFVRNTFGNNCYGNAFNYACNNNTFGDRCSYNIFGTDCSNNVFGNGCCYNIFRNDCSSNNFGNGCCYNIFDTDYFYFNNIDNWVKYVHVTANPTTTISKLATNYHITSSVKGIRETTDGRQNILVSPGRSYITTVDMDSGGTVKYYCVADLLNNWEPPQPK